MQYVKGPLLIVAGAGSGKTSLLACKIAWLIRDYGVDPAKIVALSVHGHTACALRAGVHEALGRKAPSLSVSTFGEFALHVVQQRPQALGLRPDFSLYDHLDSEAAVARLLRELQPPAHGSAADVWRCIARWKRGLASPPQPPAVPPGLHLREPAASVYARYEEHLQTVNAADVAGLVRQALRLLAEDAALLAQWQQRVRFLLVDEYEQSSPCEHELVRLLAAAGAAVTAAGDDNQIVDPGDAAGPDNLARLRADLPDLRVVQLEQNYRSSARILQAANRFVAGGCAPRRLWLRPARPPGAPLRLLYVRSEHHEAEGVVQTLLDHKLHYGDDFGHYAVLFRRAEQAVPLERALQAHAIPYHVRGGSAFFGETEVRDFLAYLKLVCNPADDSAFLHAVNTPRRDIDRATLEQLLRFAAARRRPLLESALDPQLAPLLPPEQLQALHGIARLLQQMIERAEYIEPAQFVSDLLAELRYEEWLRDTCNDFNIAARRMDKVLRLVDIVGRLARQSPDAGLRALLTQLHRKAVLDPQSCEVATEGVALMPLSAAHGMEFVHVYLVGLDDVLLAETEPNLEPDTRRLAYVGTTRARETLTFSIAEHRQFPGATSARPVMALNDLPAQDVERIHTRAAGAFAERVLAGSINEMHDVQRWRR